MVKLLRSLADEIAFAIPLFRECFVLSTAIFVSLWSFSAVIPSLENVICVILITILAEFLTA